MHLIIIDFQCFSVKPREIFALAHEKNIILHIAVNDEAGLLMSTYSQAFALSYGKKLSALVLSDDFSVFFLVFYFL